MTPPVLVRLDPDDVNDLLDRSFGSFHAQDLDADDCELLGRVRAAQARAEAQQAEREAAKG